jgi:hypothetical protein
MAIVIDIKNAIRGAIYSKDNELSNISPRLSSIGKAINRVIPKAVIIPAILVEITISFLYCRSITHIMAVDIPIAHILTEFIKSQTRPL